MTIQQEIVFDHSRYEAYGGEYSSLLRLLRNWYSFYGKFTPSVAFSVVHDAKCFLHFIELWNVELSYQTVLSLKENIRWCYQHEKKIVSSLQTMSVFIWYSPLFRRHWTKCWEKRTSAYQKTEKKFRVWRSEGTNDLIRDSEGSSASSPDSCFLSMIRQPVGISREGGAVLPSSEPHPLCLTFFHSSQDSIAEKREDLRTVLPVFLAHLSLHPSKLQFVVATWPQNWGFH